MTTPASSSSHGLSSSRLLPARRLRRHVLVATGVGLVIASGFSVAVHRWLNTSPMQPLIGMAVFFVMAMVAVRASGRHHPFATFGAGNIATTMRAALVASVAGLIAAPASAQTAWLVVPAAAAIIALDGVDGWLARRTRMSSVFGARFDMETDAFFLLVLSALVWRHDKAGVWVIAIGLMRYAFVASGWWLDWMTRPLRATHRGRVVALMQMAVLAFAIVPVVPPAVSGLASAAALATLVWSFAIDVRRLSVGQGESTTHATRDASPVRNAPS